MRSQNENIDTYFDMETFFRTHHKQNLKKKKTSICDKIIFKACMYIYTHPK